MSRLKSRCTNAPGASRLLVVGTALLCALACPSGQPQKRDLHSMATTVRVHLLEGFENDEVVVLFSGSEVYRGESVTTAAVTGSAAYFEAEASAQRIALEVLLSRRGVREVLHLDLTKGQNIALSLEGGRISLYQSKTPLGSM